MGIDIKKKEHKDGTCDVDVTCTVCGGPITHSDEYGMWCDNECGRERSIKAQEEYDGMLKGLISAFTPKRPKKT